jgi:uncharacterized protein (DUF4415 family)
MKRAKRPAIDPEFEFPEHFRRVPREQMRIAGKEDVHPRHTKIRVNIFLDEEIIKYFKRRANKPNTQPYQTQINAELRRIMEGSARRQIEERWVDRLATRIVEKLGRQLR